MTETQRRRELLQLHELLAELERRRKHNRIDALFPDDGPLARSEYPKHLEFIEMGAHVRERCMLAGNRVGKSLLGGYEVAMHLTGQYPDWWQGRRFAEPVRAWIAGDTNSTVRDICQLELMGQWGDFGTGLIPHDAVADTFSKPGVPNSLSIVHVKHASGGVSIANFKSYAEGRISFQGTSQHVIWLDEEPPDDIYTECVLRTMATADFEGGMVICTFTPLMGLSTVVQKFLPGGKLQ